MRGCVECIFIPSLFSLAGGLEEGHESADVLHTHIKSASFLTDGRPQHARVSLHVPRHLRLTFHICRIFVVVEGITTLFDTEITLAETASRSSLAAKLY